MNEKIKKEIDEVMEKEGDVRGDVLKDHFLFIKEKEGEEGIKKMEKILEEYGYPLKEKDVKILSWYKDAYCGVMLLVMKEFFQWEDEDFVEMGRRVTRYSFIATRIMMRYLVSIELFLREAPKSWKKHLNFGELEVINFNKEEGYVFLKVKNYDIHPLTCLYQKGYYAGLFSYVLRGEVTVEEKECLYKGDDHHLYKISWK